MKCDFNVVRERDMDVLFVQAILTDEEFARIIVDSVDEYKGKPFTVLSSELSHTELNLGESDITVIFKIDETEVGFLIEDKIDAPAMEDQRERYDDRGNIGIEKGYYSAFKVFIFCPEKYRNSNEEAKEYPYFVSYEKCMDYFLNKTDSISSIRAQQFHQAISQAKKVTQTNLNEAANAYYQKYKDYQSSHYPMLNLRTSKKSNGWWPHYRTRLGKVYLYHKTQEGFVDLTFPYASTKMDIMETIAAWLREHNFPNAAATVTAKSASIRINVPRLEVTKPFEETKELRTCFEVIASLSEFANLVAMVDKIKDIKEIKK